MYSSTRAKQVTKKDIAFLVAGIHDNVILTGVKYEESPTLGKKFIEFKFEKGGYGMTHTEWEPSTSTPQGALTAEAIEEKCAKQFSRIEQILSCYYTPEQIEFTDGNFKEFAEWVVKLLSSEIVKETKVRIKAVYNEKGYTTLPKYARYTFIEPMTKVNEGTSLITKLNIDIFEKPIIADKENNASNPFKAMVTPSEAVNANDLPF